MLCSMRGAPCTSFSVKLQQIARGEVLALLALLDWPLVDLRRRLKIDENRVSRRAKDRELENYCRIVANVRTFQASMST